MLSASLMDGGEDSSVMCGSAWCHRRGVAGCKSERPQQWASPTGSRRTKRTLAISCPPEGSGPLPQRPSAWPGPGNFSPGAGAQSPFSPGGGSKEQSKTDERCDYNDCFGSNYRCRKDFLSLSHPDVLHFVAHHAFWCYNVQPLVLASACAALTVNDHLKKHHLLWQFTEAVIKAQPVVSISCGIHPAGVKKAGDTLS